MRQSTLLVLLAVFAFTLADGEFYVPRAYYTIDAEGHESLPVPLRRLRRSVGPGPYVPVGSSANANANANAEAHSAGDGGSNANANANADARAHANADGVGAGRNLGSLSPFNLHSRH